MRVAIVNDQPLAIAALRQAISLAPDLSIAWVANDGQEAVQACARDTPDVLLMDLIMPVMSGVQATQQIMAKTPCAIVVVTVDVARHTSMVFEAMGFGALDAVDTPILGTGAPADAAAPLLRKLRNIGWLIGHNGAPAAKPARTAPVTRLSKHPLIAMGSSAGGPPSLARILGQLPANFPAAIVLVQHVDVLFAQGMVNWLNDQTLLPVRIAKAGDVPEPGTVLLAGTNDHIRVAPSGELRYTSEPEDYLYRPSIDVFFESVAKYWSGDATGVLLTGMGRDGARGLKAMRDHGFFTIAQDQATSAVYGMPKAAANLNAAVSILALDAIAPMLMQRFATPPAMSVRDDT